MRSIAEFAPSYEECGVGLVLQDDSGRYLFFIAGSRHACPPGELFYAGIGGHREPGEDWQECAHREAMEEIGTDIKIISASTTWHIPQDCPIQQVQVIDKPRPLAFYEMIHPANSPRVGELYRIVIYKARLLGMPKDLPPDEVLGIIALTKEQIISGPERKPTLDELVEEGCEILGGGTCLDPEVRLYPLGTAVALAEILQQE